MGFAPNVAPMHFVRGLQGLLALVTMGLLAHVAQWFNNTTLTTHNDQTHTNETMTGVPNEISYAIFVTVFTLLITLPYVLITPRYFPQLFRSVTKFTVLTFETLSMILWFAAFIAVAACLGRHDTCGDEGVCHCAKAGVVIGAISWLTWCVTSLFALRFCIGSTGMAEKAGVDGGDRRREKVLRKLRLHSVWTGHGAGDQEVATAAYDRGYGRYGQI